MFGATLVPSAANQYKYQVPPVDYWGLVDGVGMGDTVSYRAIRYTDIAWLGNALREYAKIQKDLFTSPRSYSPFYQTTNTLTMKLENPYGKVTTPSGYYVNWYGSSSLPTYLDGDKDLSASLTLPAGYNGSVYSAWPVIAGVSSADQWSTASLFTALSANSSSRVLLLSTITNTYWSLKKLHALKWVSPSSSIYNTYATAYRIEQDGNNVNTYYDWDWDTESWTASVYTNSYTLSGAGQFTFVAYSYSSKSYDNATDSEGEPVLSPVEKSITRVDAYPYYTSTSAIPYTLVINDPIGGVYNSDKQRIGNDISWRERIDSCRRVSCFSVAETYSERFAATAPNVYQTTNYTGTAYVLVDTSDGPYIEEAITSSGFSFKRIHKGFTGLSLGDSQTFFRSILGGDRIQELAKECEDPREPEFDEWHDADFLDAPSRTLKYTVSHLWTVTVIKPKYTCTFDGN
jgi:hypothetical protein